MIAAIVQTHGDRIPVAWMTRGGSMRQAVRGAVLGAPLPICACGVLPVAHALRQRGAGAALVIAFMLATPELGVESFALTVRFLGWEFALVRLVAAVGLAIAAAVVASRFVDAARAGDPTAPETPPNGRDVDLGAGQSRTERALGQLDELFVHVWPYTIAGLLAAAYVQAAIDESALRGLTRGSLDVLVVTLVSIPVYVCAASATPLAAVLIAKGLSPGAALVGLLLGPATNVATLGFLRATFGLRAVVALVSTALLVAWGLAFAVNHALPAAELLQHEAAHAHEEPRVVAWACLVALGLLTLRAVYRYGVTALASGIVAESRSDHGHAHGEPGFDLAHGHGHGGADHGHGHGHGHGGH